MSVYSTLFEVYDLTNNTNAVNLYVYIIHTCIHIYIYMYNYTVIYNYTYIIYYVDICIYMYTSDRLCQVTNCNSHR